MIHLAQKVLLFIRKHNMIREKDKVLAACSGGPDSVTLLHILLSLRNKLDCEVAVSHINHGMRGVESDRDAAFVKKLAEQLNMEISISKIQPGLAVNENSARKHRYRLLEMEANKLGCNKIATGHTADDQVETVLFFALRGAGIPGLAGIPPVREKIVRPLLNTWREDISKYLSAHKIPFIIDSTNNETYYTRNKIRALIPKLEEAVPGCSKNLSKLSERAALVSLLLESQADADLQECTVFLGETWEMVTEKLLALSSARRNIALHRFLEKVLPSNRQVEQVHIEALNNAIDGAKGPVRLVSGFEAISSKGKVIIRKTGKSTE